MKQTFKQYLLSEEEVKSLKDLIEKECSYFLKLSNKKAFIYRGIQNHSDFPNSVIDTSGNKVEYVIKQVRKDRKPLHSSVYFHDYLDEYFENKFGFKARSETMFCYGDSVDISDIRNYGYPCVVFPIGEFKYVWSPKVEDLFALNTPEELTYSSVSKWAESLDFTDKDFDKAILSKSEILIKCDRYIAFPLSYVNEISKALGINEDDV